MAVSPYDQAAWSTYTPLSSQEILQPALMMRERHDRLDEEYAALDDEVQKLAFIAETENDPAIQQMYGNYVSQLESGMNELMERGVTPNSRRKMLGVRSRFQSQIAPIRQAYELKQQDINQINQMRMKDPTFIGPDPTQRSLTDYLSSGLQPMGHQGISGALLTQMANQYLAPYSQELTDTDLENLLLTTVGEKDIPQYMEYIKKHGYKPGTEGHRALMEAVSGRIMESTGISEWANEDQLRQAQGYINMAETATIGKDQSQVLNNNAFVLAAQRQANKEAASESNTFGSGQYWRQNTREASALDLEAQRLGKDDLNKYLSGEATSLDKRRSALADNINTQMSEGLEPGMPMRSKTQKNADKKKIEDTLKAFENGVISEEEFRQYATTNMVREEDIGDYITSVKGNVNKQYETWLQSNPGGTVEQFQTAYEDDYNTKRVWAQSAWMPMNTAVQSFVSNMATNDLANMSNRDDVVFKDNKGRKRKLEGKDFDEVQKNATFSGINFYNPDTDSPTMDFVHVKEGKTTNISIPITFGTEEVAMIEPYVRTIKEIMKPITEDRKVVLQSSTGESLEYEVKKIPGGDYYLQRGNEKISLTTISKWAREEMENMFVKGSAPQSKL